MNTAWVVEFQGSKGEWVPFDIEWTRADARKTLAERRCQGAPASDLRIRKWGRKLP